MAERTEIAWCDSTFNPWIGCTQVGPGCDDCYAKADFADRKHRVVWGAGQARSRTAPANWKKPPQWNAQEFVQCPACGWRGEARDARKQEIGYIRSCCPSCDGEALTAARRRVFCASLADVFDNEVSPEWRKDLFSLISRTSNLDWLLLTKRIGNAAKMLPWMPEGGANTWIASSEVWPNVWLGATVVNQAEADRDIPKLLGMPAAVRFLSMEPLLGHVELADNWLYGADTDEPRLDWVIVGGESGHKARPMHPDWARSVRDQCAAAGARFLFKQWGEWAPWGQLIATTANLMAQSKRHVFDDGMETERFGKSRAGRLLDGVEHNGFPEVH